MNQWNIKDGRTITLIKDISNPPYTVIMNITSPVPDIDFNSMETITDVVWYGADYDSYVRIHNLAVTCQPDNLGPSPVSEGEHGTISTIDQSRIDSCRSVFSDTAWMCDGGSYTETYADMRYNKDWLCNDKAIQSANDYFS